MDFHLFFSDQFDRDFRENLRWISHFEQHEAELNSELLRLFSHILNAHHIWNTRLFQANGEQLEAESDLWDVLPLHYFEALAKDNHQKTQSFLDFNTSLSSKHYYTENESNYELLSVDILQHILMHSNHHRAQLILRCKSTGIPLPENKRVGFL